MPLHPQVVALLERLTVSPFDAPDIARMRELHDQRNRLLGPAAPDIACTIDRTITGPGGGLHVRIWVPLGSGATALPALVWLHGGGWALSSADACEPLCRLIANEAACVVVAVDYRLAPEHKFPAAVVDCLATVVWLHDHANEIGVDAGRIAVGGDSSGGNLAAVVAQHCRSAPMPRLTCQVLVYPLTDLAGNFASMDEYADGPLLTRAALRWFGDQYLNNDVDKLDPRASPLRATDLAGVAPALIVTAECDPVRDEGKAYALKLEECGVPVVYSCFPGMIHPFLSFGGVLDDSAVAVRLIGATLRAAFTAPA